MRPHTEADELARRNWLRGDRQQIAAGWNSERRRGIFQTIPSRLAGAGRFDATHLTRCVMREEIVDAESNFDRLATDLRRAGHIRAHGVAEGDLTDAKDRRVDVG